MTKPFKGVINVDIKESVPDWAPYTQPIAPPGAPNVLYVVLDDVGFSAMEPFGGLIETPNINRIAERGLTYTNFHTTALCSPTRSCLVTGRNHTTNGMATITEAASGFPSSNGHIPFECGTLAEVLGERGWNTYMTGKWHLTPEDEMNLASVKNQWPVGRGFERFCGRRPILARGNAKGDIPMLNFATGSSGEGLRLLVRHDDPEREFDYKAGAERSLERAASEG